MLISVLCLSRTAEYRCRILLSLEVLVSFLQGLEDGSLGERRLRVRGIRTRKTRPNATRREAPTIRAPSPQTDKSRKYAIICEPGEHWRVSQAQAGTAQDAKVPPQDRPKSAQRSREALNCTEEDHKDPPKWYQKPQNSTSVPPTGQNLKICLVVYPPQVTKVSLILMFSLRSPGPSVPAVP